MYQQLTCRICSNSNVSIKILSDKMYGLNDKFEYMHCYNCGCLQSVTVGNDLSEYYQNNYYSFRITNRLSVRNFLICMVSRIGLFKHGTWLSRFSQFIRRNTLLDVLRPILQSPNTKILDVGCGSGSFLYWLKDLGLKNLFGIDPNVLSEVMTKEINIKRCSIEDVDDTYDIIMFNHSLEHIPDQLSALKAAASHVSSNGYVLVRVPVIDSFAYKAYKENWVQLDAPRHIYLHSRSSLIFCAMMAGLSVVRIIDDSSEFQFWGSELYRDGSHLFDINTGTLTQDAILKSKFKRRLWKKLSRELNENGMGDQSIFVFQCLRNNY